MGIENGRRTIPWQQETYPLWWTNIDIENCQVILDFPVNKISMFVYPTVETSKRSKKINSCWCRLHPACHVSITMMRRRLGLSFNIWFRKPVLFTKTTLKWSRTFYNYNKPGRTSRPRGVGHQHIFILWSFLSFLSRQSLLNNISSCEKKRLKDQPDVDHHQAVPW